ncbi:MAG: uroporphyrinogen decarboxylase family protein [Faecousia sp.]
MSQDRYAQKFQRLADAIALKEPDQIPFHPEMNCFPYLQAGYTMAEILYDTDLTKTRDSIFKYLHDFDPDALFGMGAVNEGMGQILDLAMPKNLRWAGMPGDVIDKNSIHQYIEFPVLEEDEFEEFFSDRSGWMLRKGLPKTSQIMEPTVNFDLRNFGTYCGYSPFAAAISTPEHKEMIQKLWKLADLEAERNAKFEQLTMDVEADGYPVLALGFASVPFDDYSDFLRGTLDTMTDMYEREGEIQRYCEEQMEITLEAIKAQGEYLGGQGRFVGMTLHKGMDSFMSREQYEKFYWKDLQKIICAIIDAGMTPYIYTEGAYNSRLDFLRDVPPGKVYYHFENVDMKLAKEKLGGVACIGGGFPINLLNFGTPEQVREEAKKLIDICAPGGGFIFETTCACDYAKRENVEALFDTIRTYGKK